MDLPGEPVLAWTATAWPSRAGRLEVKRRTFNLGAAGAALSAIAPRMSAAQQGAKRGGEVVIAIVQPPPSLDAHITSAQAARDVTLHIFETLYARDENAKPVPELATGVSVSQ